MPQPTSRYSPIAPAERLPAWLRRPVGDASALADVQAVVKQQRLHTICEEGRCPNRAECYAAGSGGRENGGGDLAEARALGRGGKG